MDYAATTPVDPRVLCDMIPYFSDNFGNPSSLHILGINAEKAVEKAREKLAKFLGADRSEIIFTSGATEGNNAVIKGIAMSCKIKQANRKKIHIITSATEHKAVLEPADKMTANSFADISVAPVDASGRVSIKTIKNLIRKETALVSIMYANNETGAIQDIAEIGKLIAKLNMSKNQKIYFHTDAVQAVNYLDCNVKNLGVDMLTISAHKIYGPKGVGAMYVKKGTPLQRFIDGGSQEFKARAGTQNVAGIVGLGSAISMIRKYDKKNKEIAILKNKLVNGILDSIPRAILNGGLDNSLLNIANMRFEGVEGEAILFMLSKIGVFVSTGSACASDTHIPSHVLTAMGIADEDAHSSIRFSLGRGTTKDDIDYVVLKLPGIINKLRGISGSLGMR